MRKLILGLKFRRCPFQSVVDSSALAVYSGVRLFLCHIRNQQTQQTQAQEREGRWGMIPLARHESTSKVEIPPNVKSRLDSHPSIHELNSRRHCFVYPIPQGSGQDFHFASREVRAPIVEEIVRVNSSGPTSLSREDLREVAHESANGDDAIFQSKYRRPKKKRRKNQLPFRAEKKYGISGKSEPGRKIFVDETPKSRHARTLYLLNRKINILMQTGYREEAFDVYQKLLPPGCEPDSYTYVHLIKGFFEGGRLKEAQALFKKSSAGQGSSCGRSELILYNVMVHGLGSAGFVNEALNLVEEMRGRGFTPDVYTYNSLLHSLGKAGKVAEALSVFESMAGKGCTPDVVSYNSVISSLGKAGRATEAFKLYEEMIKKGCFPDILSINTLLPILGKAGKLDLALDLYKSMTKIGCEPDVYTYSSLVTSLCMANRVDEALLVSVEMTEKGCAPNTVTFNSWLNGLCKGGRVIEAHILFQKMLDLGYAPDKITYCILIDAYCKTGQNVNKSFDLLKDLLKCNCVFDKRTSDIVFQSFNKRKRDDEITIDEEDGEACKVSSSLGGDGLSHDVYMKTWIEEKLIKMWGQEMLWDLSLLGHFFQKNQNILEAAEYSCTRILDYGVPPFIFSFRPCGQEKEDATAFAPRNSKCPAIGMTVTFNGAEADSFNDRSKLSS